jgi:hypothetical protein
VKLSHVLTLVAGVLFASASLAHLNARNTEKGARGPRFDLAPDCVHNPRARGFSRPTASKTQDLMGIFGVGSQ